MELTSSSISMLGALLSTYTYAYVHRYNASIVALGLSTCSGTARADANSGQHDE